jgi:hypothetical protein
MTMNNNNNNKIVPAFDGPKTRTECGPDHLDYTDTLDGGVCNDCGAELVIFEDDEPCRLMVEPVEPWNAREWLDSCAAAAADGGDDNNNDNNA